MPGGRSSILSVVACAPTGRQRPARVLRRVRSAMPAQGRALGTSGRPSPLRGLSARPRGLVRLSEARNLTDRQCVQVRVPQRWKSAEAQSACSLDPQPSPPGRLGPLGAVVRSRRSHALPCIRGLLRRNGRVALPHVHRQRRGFPRLPKSRPSCQATKHPASTGRAADQPRAARARWLGQGSWHIGSPARARRRQGSPSCCPSMLHFCYLSSCGGRETAQLVGQSQAALQASVGDGRRGATARDNSTRALGPRPEGGNSVPVCGAPVVRRWQRARPAAQASKRRPRPCWRGFPRTRELAGAPLTPHHQGPAWARLRHAAPACARRLLWPRAGRQVAAPASAATEPRARQPPPGTSLPRRWPPPWRAPSPGTLTLPGTPSQQLLLRQPAPRRASRPSLPAAGTCQRRKPPRGRRPRGCPARPSAPARPAWRLHAPPWPSALRPSSRQRRPRRTQNSPQTLLLLPALTTQTMPLPPSQHRSQLFRLQPLTARPARAKPPESQLRRRPGRQSRQSAVIDE